MIYFFEKGINSFCKFFIKKRAPTWKSIQYSTYYNSLKNYLIDDSLGPGHGVYLAKKIFSLTNVFIHLFLEHQAVQYEPEGHSETANLAVNIVFLRCVRQVAAIAKIYFFVISVNLLKSNLP